MSKDAFGNDPAMTHDEMVEAGLIEDDDVQTLTPKGEMAQKRIDGTGLTTYIKEASLDDEHFADMVAQQTHQWITRGDGVAIYRNMDLGHRDNGALKIASFGSSLAQIETDEEHLPTTLPDIGGVINWRYQLVGWYR